MNIAPLFMAPLQKTEPIKKGAERGSLFYALFYNFSLASISANEGSICLIGIHMHC